MLFAAFTLTSGAFAQSTKKAEPATKTEKSLPAKDKQFSKEALAEKLVNLEGNNIAFGNILQRHKGKAVLIEVWASWCGDCVKAMPLLKDTQAKNPDADYIFISMDKAADKWKEGIEKHELKGEHYWAMDGMKGAFGKAIDLDWIPRYIVIDKSGKVVLYRAVESDFEAINAALDPKAAKERAVIDAEKEAIRAKNQKAVAVKPAAKPAAKSKTAKK